jgi:hypothetical protein
VEWLEGNARSGRIGSARVRSNIGSEAAPDSVLFARQKNRGASPLPLRHTTINLRTRCQSSLVDVGNRPVGNQP